jgi:hypothetical protein
VIRLLPFKPRLTPSGKRAVVFVVLKAGTYAISPGLISHNYTPLRGTGAGKTVLTMKSLTGAVITVGVETTKGKAIKTTLITVSSKQAGYGTLHVADVTGFSVGQHVFVQKQVMKPWIASLGMNALVRDRKV